MSQEELDALVAEGAIESVAADPETARIELGQARLHVESAAEIAERDPVAAFAIGYDSIRKALSAHMRSRLPRDQRKRPSRAHWSIRDRRIRRCSSRRTPSRIRRATAATEPIGI